MNLYCPLLCGALTHGTHCSYLDNIVDKNIRSLKKYLSQFTDVRILETETLTKYSSVELLSRSTDVPSIEIVPFYIPLTVQKGSPFSTHSLAFFFFVDFFDDGMISSLTVPPGSLPGFHYPLIWNILIPELKEGI